jgi:hypothetical protein
MNQRWRKIEQKEELKRDDQNGIAWEAARWRKSQRKLGARDVEEQG